MGGISVWRKYCEKVPFVRLGWRLRRPSDEVGALIWWTLVFPFAVKIVSLHQRTFQVNERRANLLWYDFAPITLDTIYS